MNPPLFSPFKFLQNIPLIKDNLQHSAIFQFVPQKYRKIWSLYYVQIIQDESLSCTYISTGSWDQRKRFFLSQFYPIPPQWEDIAPVYLFIRHQDTIKVVSLYYLEKKFATSLTLNFCITRNKGNVRAVKTEK